MEAAASRPAEGETEPRAGSGRSIGFLLGAIFAVMFLALGATLCYAFVSNDHRATAQARTDASYQARLAAASVDKSLNDAATQLPTIAASPGVAAALQHPDKCTLNTNGVGDFATTHLDLVLPSGKVVCSSLAKFGAPPGASDGHAPWLSAALKASQPVTSAIETDPLTGKNAIVLAAAISSHGRVTGVVALVLPTDGVAANLAQVYGGPRHVDFLVTDPGGVVRSTSVKATHAAARGVHFTTGSNGDQRWPDGARRVTVASSTAGGWTVQAGLTNESISDSARNSLAREALLALAGMVVLAAMGFLVYRRIVRPVRAITKAIVAARDNPLPSGMKIQGPAEIAILAREFNMMLEARLGYEGRITNQALHDDLTGLPNRALIHDRLDHALHRDTITERPVAVLFIDLDRFKVINDSLGHPAGDQLLRIVAERLLGAIRPMGTVGRFGGDEFVVVCDEVLDTADAVELAATLGAIVAEPVKLGGTSVSVTAAIGITLAAAPGRNPDDLVREADTAMYQAKQARRSWELFDEDLRTKAHMRLDIEQNLRAALDEHQFAVHYQPIYEVESGGMSGVEALLRWTHPTHGSIGPNLFIPVAEATGIITAIGQFVLTRACRDVAALNRSGADLRVAVNVSVQQLTDDFPQAVRDVLAAEGLSPDRLTLEITESALVESLGIAADTITRLRALGLHISIDDFGTGYSSLSYLQHFTVDELKIDRSFVEQLEHNDRAATLIRAITTMASSLGLQIIAEGVETPTQMTGITQLGCTHVQGYLLARPMPLAQLAAEIQKSRRPVTSHVGGPARQG